MSEGKQNAKDQRHRPETEKILRQFLSLESVNANSAKFRDGYDHTFGERQELNSPVPCTQCTYEATTVAEWEHHVKMTGHAFNSPAGPYAHLKPRARTLMERHAEYVKKGG